MAYQTLLKKHLFYQYCRSRNIPKSTTLTISVSKLSLTLNLFVSSSHGLFFNCFKLSIILFRPLTGKTHQLRIVSKHLNCPIIGDKKYNKQSKYNLEELKLNAFFLQFVINNKEYEFKSKLPNHFDEFLYKNEIKLIFDKDLSCFLHL